jgi:hypothetical protein
MKTRATVLIFACTIISGCATQQAGWSGTEVAWLFTILLALTGCMIYFAHRVTYEAPGSSSLGPALCLMGLFFLLWGSKFELINWFGFEAPNSDQWGFESVLFSSVLKGTLNPSLLIEPWVENNPFFWRLLAVTILKLNGQWDPIVAMVATSLIYSLILTGLCLVLWRLAGRSHMPLFCLAIGIIGISPFFGLDNTIRTFHSFYFVLGFSLLSIVLLVCSGPFTTPWFLGLMAALFGQFSAGTGFFAPFVVACVMLFDCVSGAQKLKGSAPAIIALVAVAFLELKSARTYQAAFSIGPLGFIAVSSKAINFLKTVAKIAAWPFPSWTCAPIVWFPFFIMVRNQFREKRTSQFQQFLLALGIWALLHAAAIAWARGFYESRYKDILSIGVLVNIIILFYFYLERRPPPDFSSWNRRATWAGTAILVVAMGISVLHLNPADIREQHWGRIREVNTAGYVLTGDPSTLVGKPQTDIPFPLHYIGLLMELLDDRSIREVLPTCIRAPLALEPAQNSGFTPGSIPPEFPSLPHRSVLGSWSADKGLSKSEYLSRPISSGYSRLVFDLAGGGPGTLLEILPSEGPAIPVNVGEQSGGWKKIVVEAPRVPFRLHAMDRSEHGWIAFSLPRELANGGYYARQICSINLLVIAFGLINLIVGLWMCLREGEIYNPLALI